LAPLIDRVVRLQDGRVVPTEPDLVGHTHAHDESSAPGPVADPTGLAEPDLDGRRTR
jgi:hypothetical protein